MTEVPAVTPVTIPVKTSTVATAVLLLLQVPGTVASLRLVVKPTQTAGFPSIAVGNGLTVTTTVARQPTGEVAVMVVVPGVMPVTRPVEALIVAMPGRLLLQVTPAVASVSVVVKPTHTLSIPLMAAVIFTVTTTV